MKLHKINRTKLVLLVLIFLLEKQVVSPLATWGLLEIKCGGNTSLLTFVLKD